MITGPKWASGIFRWSNIDILRININVLKSKVSNIIKKLSKNAKQLFRNFDMFLQNMLDFLTFFTFFFIWGILTLGSGINLWIFFQGVQPYLGGYVYWIWIISDLWQFPIHFRRGKWKIRIEINVQSGKSVCFIDHFSVLTSTLPRKNIRTICRFPL